MDIPPGLADELKSTAPGAVGALMAFALGRELPLILRFSMLVGGIVLAYLCAAPLTAWMGAPPGMVAVYGFLIGLIGMLAAVKLFRAVEAIKASDIRDLILAILKRKAD